MMYHGFSKDQIRKKNCCSLTHLTESNCLPPKVLDLHENKLTSLPEDIGKLALLQVKAILNPTQDIKGMSVNVNVSILSCQILNVEKNRLKALPDSIGDLRLLQTLSLKGMMLMSCLQARGHAQLK